MLALKPFIKWRLATIVRGEGIFIKFLSDVVEE
jgi:hypothetical protein